MAAMIMAVRMVVVIVQQPRTPKIYQQPNTCNQKRFAEIDRQRCDQTSDALVGDEKRNHRQNDRA